jgi:flagellar motor switch protein FliM
MEKILNQEEIDLLFRAAQKGNLTGAGAASAKQVSKSDIREVGQINKEQVRAVSILHENFARSVTNSLGAYLRVGFEVNIVSIEQLNYSEVVSRMSEMTYLCSIRVRPLEAFALLQVDSTLAFPIMDLILGGAGENEAVEVRYLTEIEEQILESVVRILIKELQADWAPALEVELDFDQRQPINQAAGLMPGTERNLALSFEIKMLKSRGMMNITLPAVVSNTILRKLRTQFATYRRAASSAHMDQLRTQMLDASFPVHLRLPSFPLQVARLASLQLGQILPFPHPVNQPVLLCVA